MRECISSASIPDECRFRWVQCQLDYLSRMKCNADRRAALKMLPPGLPRTYRWIFEQMSHEDRLFARRVLKWLIYGSQCFRLQDLAVIAAIDPTSKKFDPEQLLDRPEQLLDILGPLVKFNSASQYVEIAHFSVTEYLTIQSPITHEDYLDKLETHGELLTSCLLYLNFPWHDPSQNISGLSMSDTLLACMADCWPIHGRYIESIPKYQNIITSFLQDYTSPGYSRWQAYFDEQVDIELPAKDMRTPLYYAALLGFRNVLANLLLSGDYIDPTVQAHALFAAMKFKQYKIILLLLEKGTPNVNFSHGGGKSPLLWSAHYNQVQITEHLLHRGASHSIIPGCHWSALHICAMAGSLQVAKVLLAHGADVNLRADIRQYLPLHFAARYGFPKLVVLFIKQMITSISTEAGTSKPAASPFSQEYSPDLVLYNCLLDEWNTSESVDRAELYEGLLHIFPNDHVFHEQGGDVYFQRKQYETAYDLYHKGLLLNPNIRIIHCIEELTHCGFCCHCGGGSTNNRPLLKGYRYRCTICENINLCSKCFHSTPFPHHAHKFQCIPTVEWAKAKFS